MLFLVLFKPHEIFHIFDSKRRCWPVRWFFFFFCVTFSFSPSSRWSWREEGSPCVVQCDSQTFIWSIYSLRTVVNVTPALIYWDVFYYIQRKKLPSFDYFHRSDGDIKISDLHFFRMPIILWTAMSHRTPSVAASCG